MPIGGKLVLKGGQSLGKLAGVEKKKKKKQKDLNEEDVQVEIDPGTGEKKIKATGISVMDGKTYEEIFDLETKRLAEGKAKNTAWGTSVRNMHGQVLHGYDRKVFGNTAEERLDIRAASKSDKFCK